MSELILFFCIFSISCGYMKIGNLIQNKKTHKLWLIDTFYMVCDFYLGAICHKIFAQLINHKK